MKKFLLFCLANLVIWLIPFNRAEAQKTDGDKVIVQIIKDGNTVTDTTIQLKEGQDPEAVKKVIVNVLEGDIQVITGKEGHQKMVWVTTDDDKHMWHAEDIDVDIDTFTNHKEMVMVYKGDDPQEVHKKVIVKKAPGGEESDETVIIESADEIEITGGEEGGSKVIIIKEKGDREPGTHEKKIKVYVSEGDGDVEILSDEDLKFIEEGDNDEENVDIYVIRKDDGTKIVKKVKKVEVTIEEENENAPVAEPVEELAPKPDKKKK